MTVETGANDRMIVNSRARAPLTELYPPDGRLPSLIDDARANPLETVPAGSGIVLLKTPAFPYVPHHILVIPDRADREPTPSVVHTPAELLGRSFQVAGATADYYLAQQEIDEVTIGWNYSRWENRKHVATQMNTLHIHVLGYTDEDKNQRVSAAEIKQRPELRMKEQEPRARLISTIFDHEVMSTLEETEQFKNLFRRIEDGNRVTYELVHGIDTFSNPELPHIMQAIHQRSIEAYDEIGLCFFEGYDRDNHTFAEAEDGRYALLAEETRIQRMNEYITARPYLQPEDRAELLKLASSARPVGDVINILERRMKKNLPEELRYGRNEYMALKGLAYATAFTGVKSADASISWRFGIDPVIFAPRDVVQASRGTFAHFQRFGDEALPPDQLASMQADEQKLVEHLHASLH